MHPTGFEPVTSAFGRQFSDRTEYWKLSVVAGSRNQIETRYLNEIAGFIFWKGHRFRCLSDWLSYVGYHQFYFFTFVRRSLSSLERLALRELATNRVFLLKLGDKCEKLTGGAKGK